MFIPTNLVDYLINAEKISPNKTAIICGNKKYTYSWLHENSNRIANALIEKNLQRGDRVVLCVDNRIETILLFWAILKANAIVSIIHPGMNVQKIGYIVKDLKAKFIFIQNDSLAKDQKNEIDLSFRTNHING